jgi:hypothetical protein
MTDEQKREAWNKLLMYHGIPPYDGGSNPCQYDGYFANSIVRDFGMSIGELEHELKLDKAFSKYRRALAIAAIILENPYENNNS